MKHFTLFKPLLMAVALLMGGVNFAWADGAKRTLNAQNYESADAADWTVPSNGTAELITGDATYGKYAKMTHSGSGNRSTYKSVAFGYTAGTGYTTSGVTTSGYVVEFDMLMRSGQLDDRSQSEFVIPTTGPNLVTNNFYSGSDFVFCLSQPIRSNGNPDNYGSNIGYDTNWYINDPSNSTGSTVTLLTDKWYHYELVVTSSSVAYTITKAGDAVASATGSKTVASLPVITGFWGLLGRQNGLIQFDNLDIYDYTENVVADAPTFAFSSVSGENRVYTITNPNGEGTLYYTTVSANEAPAVGNAAYSSTTNASANVSFGTGTYYAYTVLSDGTTTSTITSQAVTGGAITLNAPVFTVVDIVLAEDGNYYPKVSFSSENSALLGSPTATLDVASPYTFTETGSLTVTASYDGYTSNSATFDVPMSYVLSKTIDFGAMTASDFDEDIWESSTGGLRDYWTNRAAKIPADATYYKLKDPETLKSDAIEGITISNTNVRQPQVYINYGLYTPYDLVSGSGNYMNLTVNDATSEDYAVFNGWNNYGSGTFNTLQTGNATFGLYRYDTMLRTIKLYSPNPVDVAILDCKQYETSDAFATAVAEESFSSAAEVYAFHTAWQIAKSKASGSTDITNVIRNAAIDASGTDWANARILNGQQYTSAPDNHYLDQYQATIDAYQTIYDLPAGSYKIKAATRGSADASGNIYVYAEGQVNKNEGINHIGNAGGTLGNGWSWTEVEFTLTATSDVKIGFYADAHESGQWAGCDDWRMEIIATSLAISAAGWATLYTPYALDFSEVAGLTAYTATCDGSTVTLTSVNDVPANTGVVLQGAADTYNIPVTTSSETAKGDLTGNATSDTDYDAFTGIDLYMLALNASNDAQFTLVNEGSIAAGKAFLKVSNSDVKAFSVVLGDTATGIRSMDNGQLTVDNGQIFNLAGQRMSKMQKGINIVNGKKVIK